MPLWAVTYLIDQDIRLPEISDADARPRQKAIATSPNSAPITKDWLLPYKAPHVIPDSGPVGLALSTGTSGNLISRMEAWLTGSDRGVFIMIGGDVTSPTITGSNIVVIPVGAEISLSFSGGPFLFQHFLVTGIDGGVPSITLSSANAHGATVILLSNLHLTSPIVNSGIQVDEAPGILGALESLLVTQAIISNPQEIVVVLGRLALDGAATPVGDPLETWQTGDAITELFEEGLDTVNNPYMFLGGQGFNGNVGWAGDVQNSAIIAEGCMLTLGYVVVQPPPDPEPESEEPLTVPFKKEVTFLVNIDAEDEQDVELTLELEEFNLGDVGKVTINSITSRAIRIGGPTTDESGEPATSVTPGHGSKLTVYRQGDARN